MALESPFGQKTRVRVLREYLDAAGTITPENAWKHVYRLLLWVDERTKLAHVYDSNHMQPGGAFYKKAVRCNDALCERLGVVRADLGRHLDILFRGCVEELLRQESAGVGAQEAAAAPDLLGTLIEQADPSDGGVSDESDLIAEFTEMLVAAGLAETPARDLAQRIEERAKHHFTIGNKRKNALGEGFEDLLELLLHRVAGVPPERVKLRSKMSDLPGFLSTAHGGGRGRERRAPKPDLAIANGSHTYAIATAKWSMRQDRETQFRHEYDAYQRSKVQQLDLQFFLITNEFDAARLRNVARAMPGGEGGYIFHQIFHINPELLRITHGDQMDAELRGHLDSGKIASLADFLRMLQAQHGTPPTPTRGAPARPKSRRGS